MRKRGKDFVISVVDAGIPRSTKYKEYRNKWALEG